MDKGTERATAGHRGISPGLAVTTVLAAAAIGFGTVYLLFGRLSETAQQMIAPPAERVAQAPSTPAAGPGSATAPATTGALPAGPGRNALSVGEMAAFVFKKEPEALPEVVFQDAAGKERSLKDWRGKVVLLNLWATWCLPCRKEMPGLDRLQAEMGSDKFEVLAVSVDRTGLEGAKKFLDSIKVAKLGLYADPTVRMTSTLRVMGMPGTLLIDAEGREVGRLVGPAEWDSADAKALIKAIAGK